MAVNDLEEGGGMVETLPPILSFTIVLVANFLFNVSFFVIIPTAASYAKHLHGDALFSGLTIGIVTFSSFVLLIPLSRIPSFRDHYMPTLDLASFCLCLGHIMYALADRAGFLYLILIGRIINGIGFTGWFFVKRYCTDPRIVGIQRRTMCTSLLVFAQTLGMVTGPILGGQLARIPSHTRLFNKNTMPGWFMAGIWIIFWIVARACFKDVQGAIQANPPDEARSRGDDKFTKKQVMVCCMMSYAAFTVFFELGSWESSIPIYARKRFGYSEWKSGNFIGVIGLGSVAVLALMPALAHRLQDRLWLLAGFLIGVLGIIVNVALLKADSMQLVAYGMQWFLVCAGFNTASSITLSLLSKNLPDAFSDKAALAVQLSNYMGRLFGAIWGTAGSVVGDTGVALGQLGIAMVGSIAIVSMWQLLKAQRG